MPIDLQAALDAGTPTQIIARLIRTLPTADLDAVINGLQNAREVKASYDALYKFTEGQEVEWTYPTNKGSRLLRGVYQGPAGEGRVAIHKAEPATPEAGLDVSKSTTYHVDALTVEHSTRLKPMTKK